MHTVHLFILYFFLYSFIGWLMETIYATIRQGHFVNRGFLNGPLCPIYGSGCVALILMLSPFKDRWVMLFLGGVVITSLIELVTGYLMERFFHARWWDYSNIPFNLKGYICLPYSLLWGVLGLFIMKVLHPLMAFMVDLLPPLAVDIGAWALVAALAVDTVCTVRSVLHLNERLRQVSLLLGEYREQVSEKLHALRQDMQAAIAENNGQWLDHMQQRLDELTDSLQQRYQQQMIQGQTYKATLTKHLAEMSDKAGDHLAGRDQRRQISAAERDRYREQFQARLQALHEKGTELGERIHDKLANPTRSQRRLLDAFPDLRSQRYESGLAQLRAYIRQARDKRNPPDPKA